MSIEAAARADGETRRAALIPPAPRQPPRDLPLLRLALMVRRNSLGAWPARAYDEMLVHRRFFRVDYFLINDPAAARRVFSEGADRYMRPIGVQRMLRPSVGTGLLTVDGEDWRRQRRMLAPAFTPQHIERLIPHFHDASRQMLSGMGSGGRFNLATLLETAVVDAVGRGLFSLPLHDRSSRIAGLLHTYFRGPAQATMWDFIARNEDDYAWRLRGRAAWSRIWFREIDAIVAARRAQPGSARAHADVLDILFAAKDTQTGAPLTAEAIQGQVATLLSAGFESTARTVFWACYLLASDLAEQDAIRAELRAAPPTGVNGLAALRAWPRLSATLLETMRLYPSVSVLARQARAPDEVLGKKVRTGDFVLVCPWVMHRHRKLWDAPEAFRPGRFLDPAARQNEAFAPFGVGRRVCIGASFATTEATILLAHLLHRFRVTLDDARPVMPVATTTTAPDIEPWFRLTPA